MSGFLTKIAHNNRVSLGPKDIRPLAELISSEKRVVDATQKVSAERTKSSIALKDWGAAEGPDLSDILSKMAQLFDALASAEMVFAGHDENYRLHFKAIRSKEEGLASLKRNQSSLAGKIDSQERKVSKMREENKDLPSATQKLAEMRAEMVGLENSVINEETALGDFKRKQTRDAMSLKLGALLELAEKTVVVGEIGKLIIDEIPMERTDPGYPRAIYNGYETTDAHMHEANRCLSEVVFDPMPLSPNGAAAAVGYKRSSRDRENVDSRWGTMQPQQPQTPQTPYGDGEPSYNPNDRRDARESYGSANDRYRDGPGQQEYAAANDGMYSHQTPESPWSDSNPQQQQQFGSSYSANHPSINLPPALPQTGNRSVPAPEISPVDYNRSSLAYMDGDEEEKELERPATIEEEHEHEHEHGPEHAGEPLSPSDHAEDSPAQPFEHGPSDIDINLEEEEEQRRLEEEWALEQAAATKADPLPTLPVPPSPFTNSEAGVSSPNSLYSEQPGTNSPAAEASRRYNDTPRSNDGAFVPASLKPASATASNTIPIAPVFPSRPSYSTSNSNLTAGIRGLGGGMTPTEEMPPRGKPSMSRNGSALGSKHGDVFVPNSLGANGGGAISDRNGGAGSFALSSSATSGYNRPTESSSGGRQIAAGAFRRPPQSQNSMPVTYSLERDSRYPTMAPAPLQMPTYARPSFGGSGGLSSSRSSGTGGATTTPTPTTSEANAIRDLYYSNLAAANAASPSAETQSSESGGTYKPARHSDEGPGMGEGPPRFDTSPLQVGGGASRGAKPTRSGTMPTYPSSNSLSQQQQPQEAWREQDSHPPPSYGHEASQSPLPPGSPAGFGSNTSEPIPVFDAVQDIYTPASYEYQKERWSKLEKAFQETFGRPVQRIVRAPGRVNCIGEHIDYSGFSVLPAAIERDALVAFASAAARDGSTPSTTTFHLHNLDPKYAATEFSIDLASDGSKLNMPSEHDWSSYFICGAKGMLRELQPAKPLSPPPSDVYLLVTGSVPTGSGLSSSSAMTTAAGITLLELADRRDDLGRRAVTEVAIDSERMVGVNSGGMDQAASVFSQPQHLLHIHFNPLIAKPIAVPKAMSFVIANSLVTSDKQTTAKFNYNLRVAETRLGALILGGKSTYAELALESQADIQDSLAVLLGKAEKVLGGEAGMSWEEAAVVLGRIGEGKALEKEISGSLDVEPSDGKLKLWKRARHVFTEARRVYQYVELLEQTPPPSDLLQQLGELMNESMRSCAEDYECSCPELDELTGLALKSGAIGSRVTGAGWGGSTVSLVREAEVPAFLEAIKKGYYGKRYPHLTEEELSDACFATKPEAGACIYRK